MAQAIKLEDWSNWAWRSKTRIQVFDTKSSASSVEKASDRAYSRSSGTILSSSVRIFGFLAVASGVDIKYTIGRRFYSNTAE